MGCLSVFVDVALVCPKGPQMQLGAPEVCRPHAFEHEESPLCEACLYGGGPNDLTYFRVGIVEEESRSFEYGAEVSVLWGFQLLHGGSGNMMCFHTVHERAGDY